MQNYIYFTVCIHVCTHVWNITLFLIHTRRYSTIYYIMQSCHLHFENNIAAVITIPYFKFWCILVEQNIT